MSNDKELDKWDVVKCLKFFLREWFGPLSIQWGMSEPWGWVKFFQSGTEILIPL